VRELIKHTDFVFATMIETMLDVRPAIFDGYSRLHRVVLQVVQHDPICRRLMTVPGVGPVASLSFKVGVDDPLRFALSRTVGAHFGLTPRRYQSGTSNRLRGADYQTGRCQRPGGALRGGNEPSAARQEVVCAARSGPSGCQAIEHAVRDCCSRAQARRNPASHVDRRK